MAIFNQSNLQWAQVTQQAAALLLDLRRASYRAADICKWVVAQQAADLEALANAGGGTDGANEAAQIQAVCQDVLNFLDYCQGGPAPTTPAGFNLFDSAVPVIGPQA